ncbi:hypothetical protein ATCVNEJV2_676L [Acanthocystis turfacea Chlorella virus NE-JV-2]|nr:hypothetical protein ATCVNEJV2_676L [Acanthocystis turfacea Chlorella virus NE-JV-2]
MYNTMNASVLQNYCNFRMTAGSIMSAIFGVILFFVGVFASKIVGDTSSYMLTDATVVSGDIQTTTTKTGKYSYTTYFDVLYNVEYTVQGKTYPGRAKDRFISFSQAKTTLDAAKGSLKRIYYNPLDPAVNAQSKSAESVLRWASFGISTLLFGYAVLAWILRDNMAMCALTTFGNITN